MKGKNKFLFYIFAVVSSLCIICIVAAVAIQAGENSSKAKTASDYMDEFGGNPDVYARILAMTDCAALQNEFDQAEDNLQEPGTPQYRWGLGYMKASDDRMREIGCYETEQMPVEQIITLTSNAARAQTLAVASPISTFTPFDYTTPSAVIQPTLAPTWTPIPTNTPFVLTLVPFPAGGGAEQCICTQDVYNCGDALAETCFNACNAQGAGDIHRLDQNNNGIACESP